MAMFDALDADGSGAIDMDDVKAENARREGRPPPARPPPKLPEMLPTTVPTAEVPPAEAGWMRGVPNFVKELSKPLLGGRS